MIYTQYSEAEATEETVLLLTRKLRRLHPEAFADVMARLPELAREALHFAEMRADTLRAYDKRDGVTREYVDHFPLIHDEQDTEDAA